jgi:hypothetical protein
MSNPYGRAGKPKTAEENEMAEDNDVTQTPEFEMALAEATAEIHDKIMAEVQAMLSAKDPRPASEDGEIQKLARAIAMSNAEIADQGTRRKRVSPEVMEARSQSLKRMNVLLEAAQSLPKSDRPLYRLRAKGYFGDRLIEPFQRIAGGKVIPTHVTFMSAPNLALEPLNKAAQEIYATFIGSISGGDQTINGRSVPDPSGAKPFWMTNNGAVISAPTATAREHGMIMEPEPISLDDMHRPIPDVGDGARLGGAVEIISVDDPRATKIPVLGTIAAPAVRGSISSRVG